MKKSFRILKILLLVSNMSFSQTDKNIIEVNSIDLTSKDGKRYYNGNLFSGKLIEKYNNIGKLMKYPNESYYKNGLKHGRSTSYFDNGNIYREANYFKGNVEGYKIRYNKNNDSIRWEYKIHGSEAEELNNYIPNTIVRKWDKNTGQIISEENIVDSKFKGIQKTWDTNGNLKLVEEIYGGVYKLWIFNNEFEFRKPLKQYQGGGRIDYDDVRITYESGEKHITGRREIDRNCIPNIFLTGIDSKTPNISSRKLLSTNLQIVNHCSNSEKVRIRSFGVFIFHGNTVSFHRQRTIGSSFLPLIEEKIKELLPDDEVWITDIEFSIDRNKYIYNHDIKIKIIKE
jgi:antitoxin component YwqK of YwqJK toxin-antitoxin module